jgi:hypothetical protein
MKGVANISEFVDTKFVPKTKIRIAAFDGENADPANGRSMGDGVLAHTPWGELAYSLAGKAGYDRVRKSDETHTAPGAETLAELFGGEPSLILLYELSVYLRKARNLHGTAAGEQLSAFLTSLFKAVESNPRVSLVYTLAIGKEGKAGDAYSTENQFIADKMAEAESISARKATLLNPCTNDQLPQRTELNIAYVWRSCQECPAARQAATILTPPEPALTTGWWVVGLPGREKRPVLGHGPGLRCAPARESRQTLAGPTPEPHRSTSDRLSEVLR